MSMSISTAQACAKCRSRSCHALGARHFPWEFSCDMSMSISGSQKVWVPAGSLGTARTVLTVIPSWANRGCQGGWGSTGWPLEATFGTQWLMNISASKRIPVQDELSFVSISRQCSFRRDGCCPPRCVVANQACRLQSRLWPRTCLSCIEQDR